MGLYGLELTGWTFVPLSAELPRERRGLRGTDYVRLAHTVQAGPLHMCCTVQVQREKPCRVSWIFFMIQNISWPHDSRHVIYDTLHI